MFKIATLIVFFITSLSAGQKIAFLLEHCLVRGTEVATFDYADYNEQILGNESYIVFLNVKAVQETFRNDSTPEVQEVFCKRFGNDRFFECHSMEEINHVLEREQIDMIYWLAGGGLDPRINQLKKKTAIHGIFECERQGYAFAVISKWQGAKAKEIPVVPHIVRSPQNLSATLRDSLHIPKHAIVFGRHGGFYDFNIGFVKKTVVKAAKKNPNWYFLFMNTEKFCNLPNVIFLEKTWNFSLKEAFINTCDAMLHARDSGETFGLSCAEFSIRNKPVITCTSGDLAHIEILGNKALVYKDVDQLWEHLEYCANHRKKIRSKNWDAYSQEYNPEIVMRQFKSIFIDAL